MHPRRLVQQAFNAVVRSLIAAGPVERRDLVSARQPVPVSKPVQRGPQVAAPCILRGVRPRVVLPVHVREWVLAREWAVVQALVPVRAGAPELVG